MKTAIYNQYELLNLREHDFSYKLVQTNLPCLKGQEKLYKQNLDKLTFKVSSLIKGPAVAMKRGEHTYLAIPAESNLSSQTI